MWQQWLNLIVGLWIILSAYIGFTVGGLVTDVTISGIIVAVLAVWGALQYNSRNTGRLHSHV